MNNRKILALYSIFISFFLISEGWEVPDLHNRHNLYEQFWTSSLLVLIGTLSAAPPFLSDAPDLYDNGLTLTILFTEKLFVLLSQSWTGYFCPRLSSQAFIMKPNLLNFYVRNTCWCLYSLIWTKRFVSICDYIMAVMCFRLGSGS